MSQENSVPLFEELFKQNNWQPIVYKGKTLSLFDIFPIQLKEKLRLVFESINSDWRQGVEISVVNKKGNRGWLIINGKRRTSVVLMQDETPPVIEFLARAKDGKLYVNNAWIDPPRPWAAGIYFIGGRISGSAMIVEELPNGRRYRCNDGERDEDFDDIVFRIERVNQLS
jgi:hypothetical protein